MTSVKRFIPCLFAVSALLAPAAVEAKCFSVCCSAQGACTQAENGQCCGEICCGQCDPDDCYSGWCTSPWACWFQRPLRCEMLDPICCEAAGGTPIPGAQCYEPARPASIVSEYDFGPVDEPDAEIACHPDDEEDGVAVDPISPVAATVCPCCVDEVGCMTLATNFCKWVGTCIWGADCEEVCPW